MILVAIGSNLPSPDGSTPRQNCERALRLLEREEVRVVDRSRWYRSAAWPPSDQPAFVNGVARVETAFSPMALLECLHRVEAEMGRVRGRPNMARIIDLDLLAFAGQVRCPGQDDDPAALRLPHPRLQERAFVLLPLQEIAPEWTHPVSRRSVAQMIAGLPDRQDCAVMQGPLAEMP
jgi:2-amino-4-hydroxy-6-hydroxymethyldihydropteridine diphosphokinase